MGYRLPYTNFHEINLDRFMKILNTLKGGLKDQILIKKTSNEFDFTWNTPKITAIATTLDTGEEATAEITGPIYNQTLELGIPRGTQGEPGAAGIGIPTGGTTNQFLKKKSNADYDTEWATSPTGVTNYNELENKPSINGVTLSGNKTSTELNIVTSADIPTKTSDLINDSGFLTSAPVTSVNNKTGAVNLTANDVGALPANTIIPSKTSELTNDSGFITSANIPTKTSELTNDSGFITSIPNPVTIKTFQNSTSWTQNTNDYTQIITITGYTITNNSVVDLEANTTLYTQMLTDSVKGLYIENNNGSLILHAIGGQLSTALTIQCSIMEGNI